ncbi:hypothetical protein Pla8534_61630 [Lignipirellula cremea]|uniref:Uncharacterized protein n=1 Tax=Lignipirellula cremea TaxID=2528010 RepID=A0A518E2I0_9BACT|nr:hypothetical protein Pla8534_61630 [Lignipirellula cremea]
MTPTLNSYDKHNEIDRRPNPFVPPGPAGCIGVHCRRAGQLARRPRKRKWGHPDFATIRQPLARFASGHLRFCPSFFATLRLCVRSPVTRCRSSTGSSCLSAVPGRISGSVKKRISRKGAKTQRGGRQRIVLEELGQVATFGILYGVIFKQVRFPERSRCYAKTEVVFPSFRCRCRQNDGPGEIGSVLNGDGRPSGETIAGADLHGRERWDRENGKRRVLIGRLLQFLTGKAAFQG